jgi:hypothetical protein
MRARRSRFGRLRWATRSTPEAKLGRGESRHWTGPPTVRYLRATSRSERRSLFGRTDPEVGVEVPTRKEPDNVRAAVALAIVLDRFDPPAAADVRRHVRELSPPVR